MGYKRRPPKRTRAVTKGLAVLADMAEHGKPPARGDKFYVEAAVKWVRSQHAYDHGLPDPVTRPDPEADCVGDT